MIDVESLIVSELEQLLPLPDGSRADWANVLHRAGGRRPWEPRLSRRRALVLAAAVLVGLAIAVPAFGLPQTVIDWFSASPAPSSTQEDFHTLDVGAPSGMAPGVSGPARSVIETQIDGKDVHLWVAPTSRGGFCLELGGGGYGGGGCDRDRQLPVSAGIEERTPQTPIVVSGDVLSSDVDHVELSFPSGESFSIPVVHVSEPINASFFVYQLPFTSSAHPDGPGTFEAIRSDGSVIASQTLQRFYWTTHTPSG